MDGDDVTSPQSPRRLNPPGEKAVRSQRVADSEACYRAYSRLIFHIAHRKFGVPESDAENLVQEVFLAYLSCGGEILDSRTWLVAVACNASRRYWRLVRREEAGLDAFVAARSGRGEPTDRQALRLTVEETLARLPEAQRNLLHLHYYEGRTAREIAVVLGTTHRYTEKLLHVSLSRARRALVALSSFEPDRQGRLSARADSGHSRDDVRRSGPPGQLVQQLPARAVARGASNLVRGETTAE